MVQSLQQIILPTPLLPISVITSVLLRSSVGLRLRPKGWEKGACNEARDPRSSTGDGANTEDGRL